MRFVNPILKNSISVKILLAYMLGVLLSILFISLAAYWSMVAQGRYFASKNIQKWTNDARDNLRFNEVGVPTGFDFDSNRFSWIFDSLQKEMAYRILDESGNTVLFSAADEKFWADNKINRSIKTGPVDFNYKGNLIRSSIASVTRGDRTWYLQFAVSARFLFVMYQGIALNLVGLGIISFSLVLLVVFSICGYITLKYTLRPLRQLSESAAAISPRSLDSRLLAEKIPGEIAPLVDSFNYALDRLEQGYRLQQDFLATAAHELKTPLALIRAQIEVNESTENRELLLNDISHMARQVQQLLLLAEVSETQNYQLAKIDIAEVVNEVAKFLQPMAKASGVRIHIAHLMEAEWQADRSALFVLIKNLLENAIQHAPVNSSVDIDITSNHLTIRDWGPGMDQDQLPKIFNRFWRGEHRRDLGAGLGMTICQEIAQAHHWGLSVCRAEPGLCFRLSTS